MSGLQPTARPSVPSSDRNEGAIVANSSAARSGLQNVGGAARWLATGLGSLLLGGIDRLLNFIGVLVLIWIAAEVFMGLPNTIRLMKYLFHLIFG